MPPNESLKNEWIKRLDVILTTTSKLKQEIEGFRERDLDSLKKNLFVDAKKSEFIEINWNETKIEIEKLEVEAARIQHYWENILDQSSIDFAAIV